jgi:UDP-glucose 4-epimerase
VLGPDVDTAFTRMFSLPVVPTVLGFDPRLQFVHEDDIVHALEHAAFHVVPGTFNVAADGVLALTEAVGLLGKMAVPVLPPWGAGLLAGPLRRLGFRIPDEMAELLRFGRGVDNRAYKATGFHYGYTSREAMIKLGEHMRVQPVMKGVERGYRYEREVEEFLRWSRHVRERGKADRPPEGVDADHEPLGI